SLWRKNTDNDDGCTNPSSWGVDLNRNYNFKWGVAGSSGNPCAETYRGPSAASEPETQAHQNLILSLFPDQRGPGDNDPAPITATGILISLHSYSELVLWPWGWTSAPAPNAADLQAIGVKFATYNHYRPQQSWYLYPTSGTTDEYAYGQLGIAAYTFEQGTRFFQDCASFENTIYPDNFRALLYAAKIPHTPYLTARGPDALNVATTPMTVTQGTPVQVTATINDTQNGNQAIAAAELYVDVPDWAGGTAQAMLPSDGQFNSSVEGVEATLDTASLALGRHVILVRGRDAGNYWGPYSAAFLDVSFEVYLPLIVK
ncbi:MAG: carboxypeptidase, partial [Chloroflexota bacterium]